MTGPACAAPEDGAEFGEQPEELPNRLGESEEDAGVEGECRTARANVLTLIFLLYSFLLILPAVICLSPLAFSQS